MTLLYSNPPQLGTPAPDFSLPGIDGKTHNLSDFNDKQAWVVIFMCNHCPYVQPQWERFVELEKQFRDRGVQFVSINSNDSSNYPEDNFEKMKEYAEEYGHEYPYLHDESQKTAKAYGAVCTPDIFVYDSDQKLAYHGRMDDKWDDPENVKEHDLADALDAILAGEKPKEDQKPSMGCSIKWK